MLQSYHNIKVREKILKWIAFNLRSDKGTLAFSAPS